MKPTQPTLLTRRHFLQIVAGSAAALSFFSACVPALPAGQAPATNASAAPAASTPNRGGTLRIVPTDDLTQFDPQLTASAMDVHSSFCTYECLLRRDEAKPGATLYPQLAEAWELSEDGLTYTFNLRKDVTFYHGTPFTAKDVEYTFQRILDPALGSGLRASLGGVAKMEIVDDHTIKFHLNSPDVALPYLIAGPGFPIVPHDRTSEQLGKEPSGTGPFQLVERVPGERIVYKRNEQYWDTNLPYVDEVQFLIIPEPAGQIAALTSGTVDIVDQISIDNIATIEGSEGVMVVESPRELYHTFVMSATQKPFDDLRVRQAFKHVMDREALLKLILQGKGTLGNDQPVSPTNEFWADVPALPYDPATAKQLLAEAGYPDGLEITLTVADVSPRIVDAAVAYQEMAKAAGITITIDKVPPGVYWGEKFMQVPFFVSWWPVYGDPDAVLSLAYLANAGYNEAQWGDPKLDELIIQAKGERDGAQRKALYAEIQKLISEQGSNIIPYYQKELSAASTRVQGYVSAGGATQLQFIWVA